MLAPLCNWVKSAKSHLWCEFTLRAGMSASLCFNLVRFWSTLASLRWTFQNTQVRSTSVEVLQWPKVPLMPQTRSMCPTTAQNIIFFSNITQNFPPKKNFQNIPKCPKTTHNTPEQPKSPNLDYMTQHSQETLKSTPKRLFFKVSLHFNFA